MSSQQSTVTPPFTWSVIHCPDCSGTGHIDRLDVDRFVACPECKGTGELEVEQETAAAA